MGDVSGSIQKISQKDFMSMYYDQYEPGLKKGKAPDEIYLKVPRVGDYVTLKKFMELLTRWLKYRKDNNQRRPNFIWIVKPSASVVSNGNPNCHETSRYQWMKQNMAYITCGPSALWETLWDLGKPPAASLVAKLLKTNYGFSGTDPANFKAYMPLIGKEMGLNLTAYEISFTDNGGYEGLAKLLDDPNSTFIIHGYCSGWTRYYKVYKGGHYVAPVKICFDVKKVWVADSDRGVIEYTLDEFLGGIKACPCKSVIVIKRH
jgi:hypothetical protein